MQPPPKPHVRERRHTRTIQVQGYKRSDGLWDIDGELTDTKDHDFESVAGRRPAGTAIHRLSIRLTVDRSLIIVSAHASMQAVPFPGVCEAVAPRYGELCGLQIGPGFRRQVMELFRGTKGCTHITELIGAVASGAVQSLAEFGQSNKAARPMQLDGCHTWDTRGAITARHFPRWHRSTKDDSNE